MAAEISILYTCTVNIHVLYTHTHTPEARKPHIIIHNTTGRYNSAKQLFHAKVTGIWVRKHCPMVSEGTQTYLFDWNGWKFYAKEGIPQQINGHDCGVFLLQVCVCVCVCVQYMYIDSTCIC